MGLGAENLHTWMLLSRYFQRTHFGKEEGHLVTDNDKAPGIDPGLCQR